MSRPSMTEEQRIMAVAMLANAIRKDEHQQTRAGAAISGDLVRTAGARGRAAATGSYVHGMRDLLAVLFDGGRAVADDCYEAARIEALGG